MSRIGIKPVLVPSDVEVKIEGNKVSVKGPKGELSETLNPLVSVEMQEGQILVKRPKDDKKYREQHGLARSLVSNMVEGVTKGYEKKLKLVGVGYTVSKKGKDLVLNLGYSHPIVMTDPELITTEVPNDKEIVVKSIDKAFLGNYVANIRKWRKPEPYKGKGILFEGEQIRRKEGKTGAK